MDIEYYVAKNKYGAYCIPKSSAYTYTSQAILNGQVHEPSTIDYIISRAGRGDIIHAGAGFGDFLPALSKNCAGRIWTFEPNRENFECAKRTIEINALDNVVLQNFGLGANNETKFLRIAENGLALGPRSEVCESSESCPELQDFVTHTLDDLFPQQDIALIHLDVEGHEFEILRGAARLIERCSPTIILEIDGRALKYNAFMASIGYKVVDQLIYDAKEMVFVNTVYERS